MDWPVREMEEADGFVVVSEAKDLDEDAHDHKARFFDGNSEKTIDVKQNHFSSEPTSDAASECGAAEAAAPPCSESEGSVDDDGVESVDGDVGEEVVVAEEPECKDGDGDHGWLHHVVGPIRKVVFEAAATTGGLVGVGLAGLAAVLLAGQQETPHRVHFRFAGDHKAPKISSTRDGRLDQGMSVPRLEHAPANISFGGSYGGLGFDGINRVVPVQTFHIL